MRAQLHITAFVLLLVTAWGCSSGHQATLPGRQTDGTVLLPNGWKLSPAGKHIEIDELPLNLDISPDGRTALVSNCGDGRQSISVVDIPSWSVVQTIPVRTSWLGLRFFDGGRHFVVSGGNDNRVYLYACSPGKVILSDSLVLGRSWPHEKISIAGLDIDENGKTLYVVTRMNNSLYIIDLDSRRVLKRMDLPAIPYTCLASSRTPYLYVSLWGGSTVLLIDKRTFSIAAAIPVGDHPNDIAESADGRRIFVANANHNTVSVINVQQKRVMETLSSALSPEAPNGSTPNSVALSPDGSRLYIANADNNCLAVMDVSREGQSRSLGFIPVGWYPTCVRVVNRTGQIITANGKGLISRANPQGPNPGRPRQHEEYIGSMFKGTLSLIDPPGTEDLRRYTAQVYANTRPVDARKSPAGADAPNPLPRNTGDTSPIKHVFYVIKENRTYDQMFGDIAEGNGDASLCLFPDSVTPNHHALARQFVLLDNIYCDAEVSADGHNWSMGAYATDYVEKTWPTKYGGRGGDYDYEGGCPLAYPSEGYIWDNCKRHGVSYRSYGEFAHNPGVKGDSAKASVEGLEGHVAPFYRGWDLDYSDVDRVLDWMKEFDLYEKNGTLPQFQIIKLPNDHTAGTSRGKLTPRAYVAQNDLALGMLVERISRSKYWKESAIFVIEDDAQNGPDHVDAHRTVALAISPYTRRHFVDSEMYSTSSLMRTMELILGLPPLSQFDAAATPLYSSFTMQPDLSAYTVRPSNIDVNEANMAGVEGQQRSEEFNLAREDAIPDIEMNEIIWKSVKGDASCMPSPVRNAFVRVAGPEREEDR